MKIVAFYLPQFHEIEENNLFWGKGFTEWTNVKKSEALFHGHRQPKLPAYLGYYDLLNEKTIESQMQLASYYGIDVFAIYIYWFNGKSIMDKPLKLLFKFAKLYNVKIFFVWANENWTRKWDGTETDVLLQQEHDIEKDLQIVDHYLDYLKDEAYFSVQNKLMFGIYRPDIIPEGNLFFKKLRQRFDSSGINIHLSMIQSFLNYNPKIYGLDSAIQFPPHQISLKSSKCIELNNGKQLSAHSYKDMAVTAISKLSHEFINFPGTMTGWDNTPRMRDKGHVFLGSEAVHFYFWLSNAMHFANKFLPNNLQIVFINAWNEWGEGAFLEPDFDSGLSKLNCVRMAKNIFTARYSKGNKYPDSDSSSLKYDFFESYKHGEFL